MGLGKFAGVGGAVQVAHFEADAAEVVAEEMIWRAVVVEDALDDVQAAIGENQAMGRVVGDEDVDLRIV